MQNPEILAVAFIQASASFILLVLFVLLYRGFPQRFLRLWLMGWGLFTVFGAVQLYGRMQGIDPAVQLAGSGVCLAGSSLMVLAVLTLVNRDRLGRAVWLIAGVGILALFLRVPPSAAGLFPWLMDVTLSALFLLGGWVLWRNRRALPGHGATLLAAALFLHALHGIDHDDWSTQAAFVLRIAFDGLLDVALGVAMAVVVLESSRARTEMLSEKLRRLTLMTATATQTFNVDKVLAEALKHLVESLGATHGVVRLLDGEGDSAELVLRAAVGFDESYAQERGRISVREPWARHVLRHNGPFVAYASAPDADIRRLMETEKLAALVLVRLPGKESTLGVLGIGSAGPREFQEDEIGFLVNVANLLGLTVQNVWLFEQVSRAQRHWLYTFDSIGDPILVHDDDGLIIRLNRAIAEHLGAEPVNLVGRPVATLLRVPGAAQSAPSRTNCPYCEGRAGSGNDVDPYLGGYRLCSTSDFHDADGRRLGTIHVLKDITERKQAEERYRNLFENVQEGVFVSTPGGRFLDFNDAFLRMMGYESREELMQVDIESTYVNPAERERLKKLLREDGAVTNYEFQMRRHDGEIITLCESSIATRDAGGAVVAYQGFVLDVTERRRAEMEIRRRNRELLVLNSIGQTLSQPLELDALLDRALRQVVELFGVDLAAIYLLDEKAGLITRPAAVGLRSEFARLFTPTPIPPALVDHLRQARATVVAGKSLPLPAIFHDIRQKEGIVVSHMAVLWSKDRVLGAMSVACRSEREFSAAELNLLYAVGNQVAATVERALLHEETRRAYENLRRAQEQLLQSEKMAAVGQLISGVAHELNNPLTAILGYGQLLAGSPHVTPRGSEYVEKLYRQAQRTHRIVQNLLSFARQRKPERVPVNLNQIVDDTLHLREYDLRLNNVQLHRDFHSGLPMTSGDAHQLQQVFLNILNNAVDALLEQPSPREIWVRTAASNGNLIVELTDSGPGVKEPSRVFDPFYTTKPVGKGTGLGLSICYGIVKEHGGEIAVENTGQPGKGATFRVLLPLRTVALKGEPHSEPGDEIGGNDTILLVDDEETLLELEREILRGSCGRVLTARSGREARAILEREQVDAVVTDMKMPGDVSGAELYQWIVQHRPALAQRVIFTMSDARNEGIRSLLDESGCPFLQKPFQVDQFLAVVRRATRQPALAPSAD